MKKEITTLRQLLDRIADAAQNNDPVSVDAILQMAGRRSFGTLLLVAGIIILAPIIGDIPGVPTLMGMIVLLTGIQLLLNRKKLWLPRFLLQRSVKSEKLSRALEKLYPVARFIDRFLKPRLTLLIRGIMIYVISAICLGIAAVIPVMELIPFSANLAGLALTAFGLSLIARDGMLALIAFTFTASIVGFIAYRFI
jgi:hypothetical protein